MSGLSLLEAPRVEFGYQVRGGTYYRVADSDWADPLDGSPSMINGGRWNPPRLFPVVYLNRSVSLARLFIAHKLRDLPYGPEDLDPDSGPVLVNVDLPSERYVDVVTDAGCAAAGLPISYPVDASGHMVERQSCWPIGEVAWRQDEAGIACRSATHGAPRSDEELAWFQQDTRLTADGVEPFLEWFFG